MFLAKFVPSTGAGVLELSASVEAGKEINRSLFRGGSTGSAVDAKGLKEPLMPASAAADTGIFDTGIFAKYD